MNEERSGDTMRSDDDEQRLAYLMGDGGDLDAESRAELDGLRDLLADPSLWAEPSPELEDRVVAAVAQEAAVTAERTVTPEGAAPATPPGGDGVARPVPIDRARSAHRGRRWAAAIVAAAAAVLVIAGLVVSARGGASGGTQIALAATPLAPGASGTATVTAEVSGLRIALDATGLPRRDGGQYYQAWLKNAAGVLVPIGTFHEGKGVTLWAGVSLKDFPTLTVTEEEADGNQASSGRRVLVGTVSSP